MFIGLSDVTIETAYDSKPDGWQDGWNGNCEVVWGVKFDTDTLPTVDIDENGNVTEFIETKLYAGWRKI